MTLNSSNLSSHVHSADSGLPGPVMVEAYSVVLSAAALVLAMVLGGGGSLTILLAIFQSRRVKKYSYTLVLVFFFLGCGLDLLWSPMELVHLLNYHHSLHNPTRDFAVATFAIYIFLMAGLAILITAFCAENVLRMAGVFSPMLRNAWPLSVCLSMFLLCLLMALAFLSTSLDQSPQAPLSYLILHAASSATRVTILTLLVLMVVLGAVAVVLAGVLAIRRGAVKTSESFLSAQSNDSINGNTVPRFLINQTEAAASNEDDDKISMSASSSKLPDIIGPDVTPATPVKSPAKLSDLSAPSPRGPSMLGVNMAQVLGRRRHTICQIGDSSTPDPLAKAKQYNYVRKFSVDISALQAQLENPKLFKDMLPFASHQDLRQRQQQEAGKPQPLESRAPLLPLPDLKPRQEAAESGGGITLSVPPRPPVITVSEDVRENVEGEIKEEEEEDKEEECGGGDVNEGFSDVSTENTPTVDRANLTDIPRLPVTQPVDEEEEEEEEEAGRRAGNRCGEEEEEASYKSSNNRLSDRDQDFIKMTLLMTLTFFLCTFPLFLIEAMKASVHPHTYVNISTCARALSVIQTIIYPHIVICMDGVVQRAVHRVKQRVSHLCRLTDSEGREGRQGREAPPEQASSNTSQV